MKSYLLEMQGHQCGVKSAHVYENENYAILQSYDTIVAFINKKTKKRYIRNWYSRTTARHVNTFFRKFGYSEVYRKDVPKFSYSGSWNKVLYRTWMD